MAARDAQCVNKLRGENGSRSSASLSGARWKEAKEEEENEEKTTDGGQCATGGEGEDRRRGQSAERRAQSPHSNLFFSDCESAAPPELALALAPLSSSGSST